MFLDSKEREPLLKAAALLKDFCHKVSGVLSYDPLSKTWVLRIKGKKILEDVHFSKILNGLSKSDREVTFETWPPEITMVYKVQHHMASGPGWRAVFLVDGISLNSDTFPTPEAAITQVILILEKWNAQDDSFARVCGSDHAGDTPAD